MGGRQPLPRVSIVRAAYNQSIYDTVRRILVDHRNYPPELNMVTNLAYRDQPRIEPRLAQRLAGKKAQLELHRPLPAGVVRRLGESLRLLLTYHSNAIEGNTLTLRETQVVIEEGLTIGGHPLREHLEATNHAHAYEYLTELANRHEPIGRDTILGLHRLVMEGIDDSAGSFRNGPVYIRGARMTPPPAGQVERLVSQWLEWIHGPALDYPPLIRAAVAHHDFEAIHPFFDGNGRTGRLLLNLMLMEEGYPPALLLPKLAGQLSARPQLSGRGQVQPARQPRRQGGGGRPRPLPGSLLYRTGGRL